MSNNKNKPAFVSCRAGGKKNIESPDTSRYKFTKMSDDEVYTKIKDIILNGSEMRGSGKVQWQWFNGVITHIELTKIHECYKNSDLTITKEECASTLNIKKKQVSKAFNRLNQEGWVCNKPVDPRLPMYRGDGNSWRANAYKIRIDNLIKLNVVTE
jgi:hypothetical protein